MDGRCRRERRFSRLDGSASGEQNEYGAFMTRPAKVLLKTDLEIAPGEAARWPARLSVATVVVAIVGVLAILVYLYGFIDGAMWIGRSTVPVTVNVADSATRQPIANARVSLSHPAKVWTAVGANTAPDGRVVIQGVFTATGDSSTRKNSCWVDFLGYWVECSAPGYRSERVPLAAYVGTRIDPRTSAPRTVLVALERENLVKPGPFAAIAADYTLGDFECIWTVRIDADGRCQVIAHSTYGDRAVSAGTVRLIDGALDISPVGEEDRRNLQSMATQLDVVTWGERLYLVPQGEFPRFLNAARDRVEPRRSAFGSYLLREGDWEKTVTGWPSRSAISQEDKDGGMTTSQRPTPR